MDERHFGTYASATHGAAKEGGCGCATEKEGGCGCARRKRIFAVVIVALLLVLFLGR